MTHYQSHYLNTPALYPHYPYINKKPHLCCFGETPDFTLISPFFQSLSPQNLETILNNYYSEEYIEKEIKKVESGERIREGVGDVSDLINFLIINLQNSVDSIQIIDNLTGEIICQIQINPEMLEKKSEELLPDGFSDFCYDIRFKDAELINLRNEIEYSDDEIREFHGFYSSEKKRPQTYILNGIRIHRPPLDTMWRELVVANKRTGRMIDADTMKTTDEFLGSCNDFNIWFLAKIERGERFFVFIDPTDGEPEGQAHQISLWFNDRKYTFRCNKLGQWRMVQ